MKPATPDPQASDRTLSRVAKTVGSHDRASSASFGFLRERIMLFGFMGATFTFLRSLIVAGGSGESSMLVLELFTSRPTPLLFTLITGDVFLLIGLIARFVPLKDRSLNALDLAGFLVLCLSPTWIGHAYEIPGWSGMIPVLGLVLITLWRAALVPSSPLRTLSLSLAGGLGHQLPVFLFAREESSAILSWPERISWLFVTSLVAVTASFVIYRLYARARDAERMGQYSVSRRIGGGGMGQVFLANHALLRRPVALKVLRDDQQDGASVERFRREVEATSQLKHPNTVSVFDFGQTPDGRFFYVMELLEGRDLERMVQTYGAFPPERVIHVLTQVCGALGEAHARGLLHRDIKPANIILCDQGGVPDFAKVVDFGLVRHTQQGLGRSVGLTGTAGILGTPLYMAPEAIRDSGPVDARADIYALGCVAYQMVTGTRLFEAASVFEICQHHVQTAPEPPSQRLGRAVPADLERVILHCLAKDPRERPQSMRDVEGLLLACAAAGGWSVRDARVWWAEHQPTEAVLATGAEAQDQAGGSGDSFLESLGGDTLPSGLSTVDTSRP